MQGATPFVMSGSAGIIVMLLVLLILAFVKRDKLVT